MKKLLTIATLLMAGMSAQANILDSTNPHEVAQAQFRASEILELRPAGAPVWQRADWQRFHQERMSFAEDYETTWQLRRFIMMADQRLNELAGNGDGKG